MRPVQPERHVLPRLVQRGALQWHQMVLLEGSTSDGHHDNHDGAAGKLLRVKLVQDVGHLKWISRIMPSGILGGIRQLSFWTSWMGVLGTAWGHTDSQQRNVWEIPE